jgi:hypothetical protein
MSRSGRLRDLDRSGLCEHHLKRDPPQPAASFSKIARNIKRQRCVELAHHGQRKIPVIAIAVIEAEAGETAREIAIGQPPMHLIHGDDVDAARSQVREHRAQECGRDLQMTVGLEGVVAARSNVVQHENRTDARKNRAQHSMRACEIQRSQSGADNGIAKLLHASEVIGRLGYILRKLTKNG